VLKTEEKLPLYFLELFSSIGMEVVRMPPIWYVLHLIFVNDRRTDVL